MTKRRMLLPVVLFMAVLLATSIQPTSAKIGTGHLYVYIDSGYNTLAPTDDKGFYEVLPGQEIYIQIANITEFDVGQSIIVKIGFEVDGTDYTCTTGPYTVVDLLSGEGTGWPGVGDPLADPPQIISWTVGDYTNPPPGGYIPIPVCQTITVHYKDASGTGPDYITYDANPPCVVAHLHVIPETPWGTIGPISALLVGLGVFVLIRRKTALLKIP